MANTNAFPLVAVDVGNTRIKIGDFEHPLSEPLPHPSRALAVGLQWADEDIANILPHEPAAYTWSIASVNRPAAARLIEWLATQNVSRVQLLSHTDLPLRIDVSRPDLVGLDRLANAVAVNRLRDEKRPAIVVDLGSAITVDLISQTGAFTGGAILPGMAMSARALHEFTDLLPLVEVNEPPPALGTSTLAAINSGLFWGAVGAVRELIDRVADDPAETQVFITGGAAPMFVAAVGERLARTPQFVPHLTLAGIALTVLGKAAKETR